MKHNFARHLRREQTSVEYKLWLALRDRRFHGFKFRRQQPIGPYVVDFVCFDAKLIIELDGGQHLSDEGLAADRARTKRLKQDGFRVRRFPNGAVTENLNGVLEQIWIDLGRPQQKKQIEDKPFRASRLVRKKNPSPAEPSVRRPLPQGERASAARPPRV